MSNESNALDCTICIVPTPLINQVWDKVAPVIERVSVRVPDDVSTEIIHGKLVIGALMLVVVLQDDEIIGVNVLDIATLDSNKRVLVVQITAGVLLDLWIDRTLALFKDIARTHNCTALRCIGVRDGWIKKLKPQGWQQLFVTMQCDLEE